MLLESKGNMEYERNRAREEMKKGNSKKKLVSKEENFSKIKGCLWAKAICSFSIGSLYT